MVKLLAPHLLRFYRTGLEMSFILVKTASKSWLSNCCLMGSASQWRTHTAALRLVRQQHFRLFLQLRSAARKADDYTFTVDRAVSAERRIYG
uniref:Secreted protein n=1 Tax=Globodera pallida TaxID=36090 RepID=A0A183C3R2_GLOPA